MKLIDHLVDAVMFCGYVVGCGIDNAVDFIRHPIKTIDSWLDDYYP